MNSPDPHTIASVSEPASVKPVLTGLAGPGSENQNRLRRRWCGPAAGSLLVLLLAESALAQTSGQPAGGIGRWCAEVFGKIRSPWFWFGMTAQFVFFMRFVVQWIVSERRRRSTVPVAFWYLSLVGSLALFVYAAQQRDPVIMAGQLLACVIYIRNLMLISDWQKRRRQAGLPVEDPDDIPEPASVKPANPGH